MFANTLKKLRENAGISQEELANALGISKSTVGMYEQGKRMPNTNTVLKKIAAYFGVTIDYLVGYMPCGETSEAHDLFNRFNIRPVTRRNYPILGKISCGEPLMRENECETIIEESDKINADFCLTALGDSMINARIFDGDTVFIHRQEIVENGEIAAIIVNDNEITLKRFFYYPKQHQVVLQPENPSYRPMVFMNDELSHIRVLGKAVAFMSNRI